jgi:hypothetical protein
MLCDALQRKFTMLFRGALCVVLLFVVHITEAKHYHAHDHVAVVANTVGPFNNPTETYPVSLYDLFQAVCR